MVATRTAKCRRLVSSVISIVSKDIPQELLDLYPIFEQRLQGEIETLRHFLKESTAPIDPLSDNGRERTRDLACLTPVDRFNRSSKNERLQDCLDALARIKAETFGICRACGEVINLDRLKLYPHVRYCRACQEKRPRTIW